MVTSYNSEAVIRPCLESLRWADELIVIDSFSTDLTVKIAQEFADKVIQHEYLCYSAQRNWSIPQASHEWVLLIDTDEIVTPELRDEIQGLLSKPNGCTGFSVSRKNHIFGKPLKFEADPQIRLFLRDKGRYENRQVHPRCIIDGKVGSLSNRLLHYGQRDLDQSTRVLMKYAAWDAIQRDREGVRFHFWHLFTRPLRAFVYRYFIKLQFLNGLEGFFWCSLMAWYFFMTYAHLWQMQKATAAEGK